MRISYLLKYLFIFSNLHQICFSQCRWWKLKHWHGHNMWISASSMERGLGLSQILLSVGGWTLSYIDFLTYVTQLLSKSVSVTLSQIVSRSVSQSQLDCQDHITRTVRWFWFARRAEGSQRLRLDLDDYDYGNDDGRDNYCDNFNRVIEDNYMISWTHSVIEGGDDYFVQDYND